MFIDSVEIKICSGNGGAGAVSFRREKFVIKGGPDGGDGGRGGDVFFLVDKNSHTLSKYRGKHILKAKNGANGEGRKKYGKKGEDLILIVPPGTQIIDRESGELLFDLMNDGEKVKILKGGKGGLGNFHFRKSTNQVPTYAQPGVKGECKEIRLELKLIADVGLVGFPNVGKSTLISTISNAKPEIANYEFTTLTPNLGVVNIDIFNSFIIADIPGIIGGASEGKGLGIEFLKHIERTNFLLFMLDIAHYETLFNQYKTLKEELSNFSNKLAKRNYAIAITRVDLFEKEVANEKIEEFLKELNLKHNQIEKYRLDENYDYFIQNSENFNIDKSLPFFIIPISSVTKINIDSLKFLLNDSIKIE